MTSENITINGAGIMGLMTAYTLVKVGHSITLHDPTGFPNQQSASYIAGGMLAPYSEIDLMTKAFITAGLDSIQIWQTLAKELNIPLNTNGSLLIAHAEDTHMLARFQQHLPKGSYETLAPQSKEPMLPSTFSSAIYLPQEAALNPAKTINALITHLKKHPNVTLTNIEPRITNIEINCTGTAAPDPHLRGVKGEIAIVENPEFQATHTIRMMHPRYPLYIVPREDNIFMIGATQIESSVDTTVSLRSAMELLSALYSLHPSFGEAKIHALKAGIRPAYPDNLPRITRNPNTNTITANGLFRHGYLLAPVIARDIAHMLENEETTSIFTKEAA